MKHRLRRRSLLALLALPVLGWVPTGFAQEERAEPEVLYQSGLWKKAKYDVEGSYRIERRGEGETAQRFLVLDERFSTKQGPDLKVVLSPAAHDEVKGKTALRGSTVLGLLESNRGSQAFELSASVDLADFRSVLIHCEEYTVLWGAAPLEAGRVLASGGDWTKKSNKVSGAWELARIGDELELRVGDAFKTKKGPDLKFFLSPHTAAGASGSNATQGAVQFSPLAAHKGAQRFRVEAGDVDLSDYRSLLLHCEQYSKLWASSPFEA